MEQSLSSILKIWFNALPYPAWIKPYSNGEFHAGFKNQECTKHSLDSSLENDLSIIASKKPEFFTEFEYFGPKWPVFGAGEVVAVSGMMEELNGNRTDPTS